MSARRCANLSENVGVRLEGERVKFHRNRYETESCAVYWRSGLRRPGRELVDSQSRILVLLMFWILQENLKQERGFERLLDALRTRGLPHTIVKVIPFSHELIPEPTISHSHVVVSGSTAMSKIATERGWKPGGFLNDNFDFSIWQNAYRGLLLNEDATICEFGRLNPVDSIFVRPCADDKTFAGLVVSREQLREWQDQIHAISDEFATLTPETLVLSATPKQILKELRFFIVDREVVTGSVYRANGRTFLSKDCDPSALKFAEKTAQTWQPDRAFVLDIAITSHGPKVIEINCISSAGFYEADLERIVDALESRFGGE